MSGKINIEYRQGQQHAKDHSIHYSPYRHKGTTKQYRDWEDGWKRAMKSVWL